MTLTINGVDFIPYLMSDGLKVGRNDVDGEEAGRVLGDAKMVRDRIAIKKKLSITTRSLLLSEIAVLLTAIEPEYVEVTYTDPKEGRDITKTFYSSNVEAQTNGDEWWNPLSFSIVEE